MALITLETKREKNLRMAHAIQTTSLSCQDVIKFIVLYATCVLKGTRREKVERHLEKCPDCYMKFLALRIATSITANE
jgi:hypothetical protein